MIENIEELNSITNNLQKIDWLFDVKNNYYILVGYNSNKNIWERFLIDNKLENEIRKFKGG